MQARNLKSTSHMSNRVFARTADTTIVNIRKKMDFISDDVGEGRSRAFVLYHNLHVKNSVSASEREWSEQERLRIWRAEQARTSLNTLHKSRDRHVLEKIIQDRNAKVQNEELNTKPETHPAFNQILTKVREMPAKKEEENPLHQMAQKNANFEIDTRTVGRDPLRPEDRACYRTQNNTFFWG